MGDHDPGRLTIPVGRGMPVQEGNDYQEKVRQELEFDPAPSDYKPGGKMPDGLIVNQKDNSRIALEVKYLSATERALRDPERSVRFIFKLDVEQARKYADEYEGGLLWVTNDAKLAQKYRPVFEEAGLSDIRVVVVPSVQE